MSVAFGAIGTVANGTTSLAVAYPTGITAGQLLVLCVGCKYDVVITNPAGWDYVGGIGGGGVSGTGADTGRTNLNMFTKIANGSESGSVTVTIASGNVAMGAILRLTKTLGHVFDFGTLDSGVSAGNDNTGGGGTGAFTVVAGTNTACFAGDYILVFAFINGDNRTWSSIALYQDGGGTAMSVRANEGTSTADDAAIIIADQTGIYTGALGDHSLQFGADGSGGGGSGGAGGALFMRVRERNLVGTPFGQLGQGQLHSILGR